MDVELTDGKITLDQLGNADMVEGIDAEKQILRNAMLIYKGGWFANLNEGVDWLGILDKQYSINTIKAEIRRVLTGLAIVTKIINLSLGDSINRQATLTFVVNTVSGNTITFSEEL